MGAFTFAIALGSVGWADAAAPAAGPAGIALEGDVRFVDAAVPPEVAIDARATLTLRWHSARPLPAGTWVFVHVESTGSACRAVFDAPAAAAGGDGIVHHEVALRVPAAPACTPQRMEVRAGLYHQPTGRRWRVLDDVAFDDRIHAATFALVAAGSPAAAAPQRWTPTDMARQRLWAVLAPWWGWLGALAASIAVAALVPWLRRRRGLQADAAMSEGDAATAPPSRRALRIGTGLVIVVAAAGLLIALDFVKDDAYISFRVAWNLVHGQGLIFNAHDRLETMTNLLWTLLLAPFEALELDLFQVSELIGGALLLALLVAWIRLARGLMADDPLAQRWQLALWPALLLAACPAVSLWTTSGMEQPLAMLLPALAAVALWRAEDLALAPAPDLPTARRAAAWGGALAALAGLTRPDLHLIGVLLTVGPAWRALRGDRARTLPIVAAWTLAGLGLAIPAHLLRYAYYGAWLPNTFYVKTGGGVEVWLHGLGALRELWGFHGIGVIAVLAPLALLRPRWRRVAVPSLLISAAMMAYIVKVGRDEMHWHRLYLPALPFLTLAGGLGLAALARALPDLVSAARTAARRPRLARALLVVAHVAVLAQVAEALVFTTREMGGWNGRGDLSGNFHPDIGKFLTRHARPGALVAFQDMGSTPYHAPDLDFFDFIGLCDRVVARTRHAYGLHAFLDTAAQRRQGEFDAEMRRYFYQQRPEWVILTTYVHGDAAMAATARAFDARPGPEALGEAIGANRYQFGIYDAEFRRRYQHVRTWPRSRGYYLSLFRLSEQAAAPPGEVVLDAAPADLSGPTARWEGGIALRGGAVQAEAIEAQEAYLTLWLQAPGPQPSDLWVFVHLEGAHGQRVPLDHLPGDWLVPGNRWRAGDLIEDRTLLQLPPHLKPGRYEVFVGLYRRDSGARLRVEQGAHDGQQRVRVGTLQVRAFRPWLDATIRRTVVAEERRHPQRISDHGRRPDDYAKRAAWPPVAPGREPAPGSN